MMKSMVKTLFDFQKFAANQRLAELISQTEAKYNRELSEGELEYVNAAGDIHAVLRSTEKAGKRYDA